MRMWGRYLKIYDRKKRRHEEEAGQALWTLQKKALGWDDRGKWGGHGEYPPEDFFCRRSAFGTGVRRPKLRIGHFSKGVERERQ